MKKRVKYIVLVAVAGLLLYNSVYIKKLDTKKETAATSLSPEQFAQQFWKVTFTPFIDSAAEVNSFIQQLKADPEKTIAAFSKTQGIGSTVYFLIKGEGIVTAVTDDRVTVTAQSGAKSVTVQLNTGMYFGNAVRDVTGKISMGDFTNTMDFNTVSATLNKIVKTTVLAPFKAKVIKGTAIQFVGCAEINTERIQVDTIELLPVKINLK